MSRDSSLADRIRASKSRPVPVLAAGPAPVPLPSLSSFYQGQPISAQAPPQAYEPLGRPKTYAELMARLQKQQQQAKPEPSRKRPTPAVSQVGSRPPTSPLEKPKKLNPYQSALKVEENRGRSMESKFGPVPSRPRYGLAPAMQTTWTQGASSSAWNHPARPAAAWNQGLKPLSAWHGAPAPAPVASSGGMWNQPPHQMIRTRREASYSTEVESPTPYGFVRAETRDTSFERHLPKDVQSYSTSPSKPAKDIEPSLSKIHDIKTQRQQRFSATPKVGVKKKNKSKKFKEIPSPKITSAEDSELIDFDSLKIVGTNENLEKMYLRLTCVPEPSEIRPERVLKKTLQMLREKWSLSPDYGYTCEQLKSLRQDMAVQHIKNEFTMEAYQFHARIALESVSSCWLYPLTR